jgi:two-component system phosphate regulon response regulator PhoB
MRKNNKRTRVLIADDEDNIRELMSYIFEEAGFITEEARNGKEALLKIAQNKPDIIILDVAMPELDGLQVCISLRGNPDTQAIPIIFLSAQTHIAGIHISGIIKKLPGAAIECIEKPCDIEYLVKRINCLAAEQDTL